MLPVVAGGATAAEIVMARADFKKKWAWKHEENPYGRFSLGGANKLSELIIEGKPP